MIGKRRARAIAIAILAVAGTGGTLLVGTATAGATTALYVDRANPACSDTGTGSAAQPFCTIVRGAKVAKADTTVFVASGTYGGDISVSNSGTAGAPITFTAGPGATVVIQGGTSGFKISSKSYVTVTGFTVTSTTGNGISASSAAHLVIAANRVTLAGKPVSGSTKPGIKLSGVIASTISGNTTDHNSDAGIYASSSSNGNLFSHNTSFANARGYVRAAAGIDLRGSTGNVLDGNVVHDNEDSGINIWTTATGTLVTNNVTYNNGDHGIDIHNTDGARIIANTVVGNYDSGIEFTGSPNGTVANTISSDNGVASTRTRGQIRVDSASRTGISLDFDVLFLSAPGTMVDWAGKIYPSVAAFRTATGEEPAGIEGNPAFRDRAAADFHLTEGSPAIDAANSGITGAPATDFDAAGRVDDPTVTDTGSGPRSYDDRGAFEFLG